MKNGKKEMKVVCVDHEWMVMVLEVENAGESGLEPSHLRENKKMKEEN